MKNSKTERIMVEISAWIIVISMIALIINAVI